MPRNSPHGGVESSSSRCWKLEAFDSHYFDPIFHFLLSRQMCTRAGFFDVRIAAEVQADVLNKFPLFLPPERKKEKALIIFVSVRLVCLRRFAVCLVSFFRLSFFFTFSQMRFLCHDPLVVLLSKRKKPKHTSSNPDCWCSFTCYCQH